jgi:hypothetical protein
MQPAPYRAFARLIAILAIVAALASAALAAGADPAIGDPAVPDTTVVSDPAATSTLPALAAPVVSDTVAAVPPVAPLPAIALSGVSVNPVGDDVALAAWWHGVGSDTSTIFMKDGTGRTRWFLATGATGVANADSVLDLFTGWLSPYGAQVVHFSVPDGGLTCRSIVSDAGVSGRACAAVSGDRGLLLVEATPS